jgi:hypothetical protein
MSPIARTDRPESCYRRSVRQGAFRSNASAICTAFNAAPFSSWSPVVDHPDPWCGGEHVLRGLGRHGAIELGGHGNRMRPQHRHANAGHADRQFRERHDLAQLPDHLGLLFVRAGLRIDRGVVTVEIECVSVSKYARFVALTRQRCARGFAQLLHGGGPGTGGGLVRRGDDSAQAECAVQRPQRYDGDDRHAIGIGDDAAVPDDRVEVDLGHHQRHRSIHTKRGRIVDNDGASPDGLRNEAARSRSACGEQRDLDALERLVGANLDGQRLTAIGHPSAGRSPGGEQTQS